MLSEACRALIPSWGETQERRRANSILIRIFGTGFVTLNHILAVGELTCSGKRIKKELDDDILHDLTTIFEVVEAENHQEVQHQLFAFPKLEHGGFCYPCINSDSWYHLEHEFN